MKITPDIHIGREIEARINQLRMSESDFARQINTSRQNVNRILKKESIDTATLQKFCDVLDYNFFTLYCPPVAEHYEETAHGIADKTVGSLDNREVIQDMKEIEGSKTEIVIPPDCPDTAKHIIELLTMENNLLKKLEAEKERYIKHLLQLLADKQ